MSSAGFLLYTLGVLAGLAVLFGAWTLIVWRVYRLSRPGPVRHRVLAADGWELALYHRPAMRRRFEEPVLLCHGLAANHRNLDLEPPYSLAMHLAEAGFECFSVEWRGTGHSRKAPKGRRTTDYTIDDHVRQDAPAFLDEALLRTGARRALWVGHSLGGLIGYAVAQGPQAQKLAGLVTLGSPAYFRYPDFMRKVMRLGLALAWPHALRQRLLSIATAPFLGHITLPLSDVVLNPQHIPPPMQRKVYAQVISSIGRKVLLQFDDWLLNDTFRSNDRQDDWRGGLPRLQVPLLVTAGACDKLASPEVVKSAFEAAGSADKTLMIFGTQNGDAMDYGHGDLVFGSGAPTEVYPRVKAWLESHATPIA